MKIDKRFTLVALATCGAIAATAVPAAETPTCTTIVLAQEFLKNYPNAPAACQGVAVKDGKVKVHYQAVVTDTSKEAVSLTFLNAYKQPLASTRTLKFTPPKDLSVMVEGKKIKATQLKKGDVLDFWMPEKMVGFHADPESTELISFILN